MKSKEEVREQYVNEIGKGWMVIPVTHGEYGYASWDYQLWLENRCAQQFASQPPAPSGMEEAVMIKKLIEYFKQQISLCENREIKYNGVEAYEDALYVCNNALKSASTPPDKEQWVKIEEGGKMPEEGQQIICENRVGAIWRTKFYGFDKGYIRWMPYTPPTT